MRIEQKQTIKRILGKVFYPYFLADRFVNRESRFTVLMYHSVNPSFEFSVKPKDFEEQIKLLVSNYRVRPLKDFFNFNENSFAITFDDGYEDNFYYVLPILKKYKCPAIFFICTGFINKEIDITREGAYLGLKPLSPGQIKKMEEEGMDFGCHTHTHSILSKIPPEEIKKEIHKSKNILKDILGNEVKFFVYPYGQINDFNEYIISILKEEGFQLACSTVWGSNTKNTFPFSLKRINIDHQDTFQDFRAKIEGRWDFIKWFHYLKK